MMLWYKKNFQRSISPLASMQSPVVNPQTGGKFKLCRLAVKVGNPNE